MLGRATTDGDFGVVVVLAQSHGSVPIMPCHLKLRRLLERTVYTSTLSNNPMFQASAP